MSERSLVVVGGSLAGLRAVEAARKAGFAGAVTLVGAESHLPYDRPPLSKAYLDGPASPQVPTFRTEELLRDDLGVTLELGTAATGLDIENRRVALGPRHIEYDALVIATGAEARWLPGSEHLDGVHVLRTLDDAAAVRAGLDRGARTVVVGAGFIGSEVASSARKRGMEVTIVEALPTPLVRAVGDLMGGVCASLHRANGTDLRCGLSVDELIGGDRVEGVRLSDGTVLEADLVVVGAGAVPATGWLAGSGLTVDDGIVCDETLWTGAQGVYAAGDVARWLNPMFDRAMRLEHWTSAAEQGARAALNAIDPDNAQPYSTVPYFWSDWYDKRVQFVGLSLTDEVTIVEGDVRGAGRCVALYRMGERLGGALTINAPTEIMKYRGLISRRTSWADALDFAESRRPQTAASDVA